MIVSSLLLLLFKDRRRAEAATKPKFQLEVDGERSAAARVKAREQMCTESLGALKSGYEMGNTMLVRRLA